MELPGNLKELLTLRLVLEDGLSFVREKGRVIAQRPERGCEYVLEKWQYETLISLTGKRSFGEVLREVTSHHSRPIPPEEWLLFYDWLYREELVRVLPGEVAIFELDPSDQRKATAVTWLQRTAILAGCLAILRVAYVVSPALEPAVDRLYAEVGAVFETKSKPGSPQAGETAPADSRVTEVALAGEAPARDSIRELREELAACRLRRDEFYLQNDEENYRREVERISELARLIGEANQ